MHIRHQHTTSCAHGLHAAAANLWHPCPLLYMKGTSALDGSDMDCLIKARDVLVQPDPLIA